MIGPFAALVLLFLAPAAVQGQCDPGVENCVSCSAFAFAGAASTDDEAFIATGVDLGAKLCGAPGETVEVSVIIETLAQASAEATAEASLECEGSGSFEASGSASARASAKAEATAAAIVTGFASVDNCAGCTAAAEVLAVASESAFVEAMAETGVSIDDFVGESGSAKAQGVSSFVTDFQEAVVPLLVAVVAQVSTALEEDDETCAASVSACSAAGTEAACCELEASGVATIIEEDAIAETALVREVTDLACAGGGVTPDDVQDFVIATGGAFASALAAVDGECTATAGAGACAWGAATVEAAASAFALATATALVDVATCDCGIDLEVAAASYQEAFVDAAATIRAQACTTGGGVSISDAEDEFESANANAVAVATIDLLAGCGASACAEAGTSIEGDISTGSCCVDAASTVDSEAEDALATATAEASVLSCTDTESERNAQSFNTAEAVATVWATAMASIDVTCDATDDFSFACGAGSIVVEETARATATAFARAWAAAEKCDGCTVDADVTAEAVADVLVAATAEAHAAACSDGAGGGVVTAADFDDAFADASVAALATALATAAWEDTGGDVCRVDVVACAESGDRNGCCSTTVGTFPEFVEEDAFADATADAATFFCGAAGGSAEAETTARATVTAWARAVTFVSNDCFATGGATVCSWASGKLRVSAVAFGEATAEAWAGSLGACGCEVEAEAAASIMTRAVARATSRIFEDFCLTNGGFTETAFDEAIVDGSLDIVARALAEVHVLLEDDGSSSCEATVDVTAETDDAA